MVKVKFIEPDGTAHELEVTTGRTLMQAAVDGGIDRIVADCGGACACATCHCYIDEQWAGRLGEANPLEEQMLKCAINIKHNSRLSCQIDLSEDLDGLIVHLPEAQF